MRIVLDTNILVRAHAKATGPARELLMLTARAPEHVLLVSPFLLRELERVLSYERVRRVTRLTEDEAAEFLFYLSRPDISEIIYPGAAPRVVPADEDDDPIVHTAVVGRANAICTLNHHFYDRFVIEYCGSHGILVANDVELLHLLRHSA